MMDLSAFTNCPLAGGFHIAEVSMSKEPIVDALGRTAVAQTTIRGRAFHLLFSQEMDELQQSISMYHEILEAATVATINPPSELMEYNELQFETAARAAHTRWGIASPDNLNHMLHFYGFRGR